MFTGSLVALWVHPNGKYEKVGLGMFALGGIVAFGLIFAIFGGYL